MGQCELILRNDRYGVIKYITQNDLIFLQSIVNMFIVAQFCYAQQFNMSSATFNTSFAHFVESVSCNSLFSSGFNFASLQLPSAPSCFLSMFTPYLLNTMRVWWQRYVCRKEQGMRGGKAMSNSSILSTLITFLECILQPPSPSRATVCWLLSITTTFNQDSNSNIPSKKMCCS